MKLCESCGKCVSYNSYFGGWYCYDCGHLERKRTEPQDNPLIAENEQLKADNKQLRSYLSGRVRFLENERLRAENEQLQAIVNDLCVCAACKHCGYCEGSCGIGGSCGHGYSFEYWSPLPEPPKGDA